MRQRLIALVVVVAFLAGLGAVIRYGSSSVSTKPAASGDLPKLPTGAMAGGLAERSAALATGAAPVAGDATTAMMYPAPYQLEYTVEGDLPTLGGTAAAYTFAGRATDADVDAVAAAVGITGTRQAKGDYVVIESPKGAVSMERIGARQWNFSLAPPPNSTPGSSPTPSPNSADSCSTSSDGTTTCSGSAQLAARCPVPPPCPPDAKCAVPAITCESPAPTRPADLPSKDDAERAARAILGRVGVDVAGATVAFQDNVLAWGVQFIPVIDGHQVPPLTTFVTVGSKGVISSISGSLGKPEKIGDYPLTGTKVGLERLKAGKVIGYGGIAYATHMGVSSTGVASSGVVSSGVVSSGVVSSGPATVAPALRATATTMKSVAGQGSANGSSTEPAPPVGTVDSGGATTGGGSSSGSSGSSTSGTAVAKPAEPVPDPAPGPMPKPTPIVITGVRLELAMVTTADGSTKLVPAYTFLTRDNGTVGTVPAVIDALLEEPQTQPMPPAPAPMPAIEPMPAMEPGTTTP